MIPTLNKSSIKALKQNPTLNPIDTNIIRNIIESMKKWFGKTRQDDAAESWDTFVEKMRKKDVKIDDFLLEYETAISRLLTVIPNIPKIILAL